MVAATITSKGQVTIPVEVRRRLGLKSGDQLLFEVEDGKVRIRVVTRKKLSEHYGALPVTKRFPGKAKVRREVGRRMGRRHSK